MFRCKVRHFAGYACGKMADIGSTQPLCRGVEGRSALLLMAV
ncbi:hypothetical protein [Candidatus Desulfovibrio trichonymphae]|nr:hypothetical protein [Candidatus Desulfovibrio trichonymphae]